MSVSEEEVKRNIEALRNKIGDARTGGKGSQRRKVKVVAKPTVPHIITSGKRWQSHQEHC